MAKCFEGTEFVLVRYIRDDGKKMTKIMQTDAPFFVASVFFAAGNNPDRIATFQAKIDAGDPIVKVPGYTIYVLPNSTITEEYISFGKRMAILKKMARYYLDSWIADSPEGYEAMKED